MTEPLQFWMVALLFLPLIGAIAAFVLPRHAPIVGMGVALGVTGAAVALCWQVQSVGTGTVALGGWGAPLGINLHVDGLSAAMLAMTAGVGAVVSMGAVNTFGGRVARSAETARPRQYFWPLWMLLLTGLNGVYLGTDIFNLYVMIEVIALAAVGLTVLSGSLAALRAGLDYMFASILGALLLLMGVGFVYLQLGRLDFGGLAGADPSGALVAALALMFVGLALKTALFPLHFWLPAAHANATAPASALLSALVVKAALYIIVRLLQHMPAPGEALVVLMGLMGTGAILWGSVQALRADRLKLLVAWSTVTQIGLIFVALAQAGVAGLAHSWKAAAVLILAHGVAKGAMFLAAGRIRAEVGHDRIRDLDRSPVRPALAQLAFAFAAVSLIGLPPSLGFIGKWMVMEGALAAGNWHWVVITMTGTLFSLAYFSRVFAGFLRFDRVEADVPGGVVEQRGRAPMDYAPLALAALGVALGLVAAPILEFLEIGRAGGWP